MVPPGNLAVELVKIELDDATAVADFCSWFTCHSQRVITNDSSSIWRRVTSGMSQSSVLDLVLLDIFINDLDKGVKTTFVTF